jgi:hypothetical protein
MFPQARQDDLVVQEVQDETLVYDMRRHRAYCLNRVASVVWRHCDGRTSAAEIAPRLRSELHVSADKQVVSLALEQLGRAHLLRARVHSAPGSNSYSRRELIRKVGLAGGAALLLPMVTSIVAPTPASAASCASSCVGKPNGTLCGGGCDGSMCCQNGLCVTSGSCG